MGAEQTLEKKDEVENIRKKNSKMGKIQIVWRVRDTDYVFREKGRGKWFVKIRQNMTKHILFQLESQTNTFTADYIRGATSNTTSPNN